MLHIIACVKVVLDPEAPVSTFRVDTGERRVIPGQGVPPVLNPYDENCLEAALRIKEQQPARITVISAGKSVPKPVIKKCLALGADDLVVLEDELFEETDTAATAGILTAAVRKLGDYDLVLTGRMAADTNAGQVGPLLAEILGIPGVTVVQRIEVSDGQVRVERVLANGREVVMLPLPCLAAVSHELGALRQANVRGLMAAQKQPFTTWNAEDLGLDKEALKSGRPFKLYIPERERTCEMVDGETPEEAGAALAIKLKESTLI